MSSTSGARSWRSMSAEPGPARVRLRIDSRPICRPKEERRVGGMVHACADAVVVVVVVGEGVGVGVGVGVG
eukprot:10820420-Alexandrium_andersonii.AAC.1